MHNQWSDDYSLCVLFRRLINTHLVCLLLDFIGSSGFCRLALGNYSLEFRIHQHHSFIHQFQVVCEVVEIALEYIHKLVYSFRPNLYYKLLGSFYVSRCYYHITTHGTQLTKVIAYLSDPIYIWIVKELWTPRSCSPWYTTYFSRSREPVLFPCWR